jgi:hypothetical protein
MAAIHVAITRRADRIRLINRQVASLDTQIAHGAIGTSGMPVQSLVDQVEYCRGEKDRLLGEVTRLSNLSDDDLVAELVPEVARDKAIQQAIDAGAPTELRDVLARGERAPEQVVVSRTPLPVRRVGGDPAPVAPGLVGAHGAPVPPNTLMTYDANGQLVPLG